MLRGSYKLSKYLPSALRPMARRVGLERHRVRLAFRELALRVHLLRGTGVKHIYGPQRPQIGDDELLVLCVVRNGAPWLPTFLRHYKRLGVKHIIFVDNGSTDRTVAIATSQREGVSVFSTELPYAQYWIPLKRWMVKHFGHGKWSLIADADELFDYPYSQHLSLQSFLSYLNSRGYNALSIQNLEMISAEPLADIQGRQEDDLEQLYRHYDIAHVTKTKDKYFLFMNKTDSDGHYLHSGGIRATAFGWAGSMLTKQSLIRYDGRLTLFPYDGHFVTKAALADVTGVFRHYKFIGSFYSHVQEEVRREQHHNNAKIFKRYAKILKENPDLCLLESTASKYDRAEDLLESGFLIASEAYRKWVSENGSLPVAPGSP